VDHQTLQYSISLLCTENRRILMFNPLPVVLVGGPPHAGKSVLFYRLSQALRERQVPHHIVQASPDGDKNWFHEGDPDHVTLLRSRNKHPGKWPQEFVERICATLQNRKLPLLVDMGGKPQGTQLHLFGCCTHALLLLRQDKPVDTEFWDRQIAEHGLQLLARLFSELEGSSTITAHAPILEGTLSGLERHAPWVETQAFRDIVTYIANFFTSYDLDKHEQSLLGQAPTEISLDLNSLLQSQAPGVSRWEPEMLVPLLASLPEQTPLSVYAVGPNWLYAALAAAAIEKPFYLFDPKFGWIPPVDASFGSEQSPEIQVTVTPFNQVATMLSLAFPTRWLTYLQPEVLNFPIVPGKRGLIIDGKIPYWLLTALVRLYRRADIPWIASHYVPIHSAVVVYSQVDDYRIGDLIPMLSV
jgi:CRISPR-associated protein Csx3